MVKFISSLIQPYKGHGDIHNIQNSYSTRFTQFYIHVQFHYGPQHHVWMRMRITRDSRVRMILGRA